MNSRRRGFAMITAIVLLSLTAMAITVLGVTVLAQATRTRSLNEDAELRALLTAGVTFAKTQIQSNATGHFPVPLPETLANNSAELTVDIRSDSDGSRTADIEASLPHHRQSESVTFESRNGTWQPVTANLNP
jgi:type II secretory pathway component PulK